LPADVRQKIDQASASLAGRAQQLRRDRDLAQALAQLAIEQQAARKQIDDAAKQLQQPAPRDNDPSQLAAAQSLQQAQQQFAAAQLATGEGAAEVSGQQEVMNRPIREGLEIASRLSQGQLPASEADNKPETDADQAAADKAPESADGKAPHDPKSKTQKPKSTQQPTQLGTKMVPSSPQVTAKQLAGQKANNAAANAMAAALKGKGEPGKNEGE